MRLRLTLLLLCFALPAYATDTALVDRDGVTQPLVLTPANIGAATTAQGAKADNTTADEVYATDYNGGALASATINAAITAISSSSKTLVISPGAWTFDANVTVPANVVLKVKPGAVFTRTAGTFTINGPIDFPRQKVFASFTAGKIVFGDKVKQVFVDWMDVTADGVADDIGPINALLWSLKDCEMVFTRGKTYLVSTPIYNLYNRGVKLNGNGCTIKCSTTDGTAIQSGWAYQTTASLSITVSKGANHFTIPGGVTLNVGEMINVFSSASYITGYQYGFLTTVTSISGGEAYFDILPIYDFTADSITQFKAVDNVEIYGFTIDNSGSAQNTSGISAMGRGINIHENWAIGNDYAGIAFNVWGIDVTIERNTAKDYLSKNVTRYGDAVAVAGHNINIEGNTFSNCKHAITIGRRDMISNIITVKGNTMTQNPARFGETFVAGGNTMTLYSGVMDIHGNAENVVIENNELDGAGIAALTIRNGKAVVKNNRIRFWNTANTRGIFMIGETTLQSLVLGGNDIWAKTASTPLMTAADGSYLDNIAVASPVYAQGVDVNVRQDGTNTFTNVTTTKAFPVLSATTLPSVCANGQLATDTDATSGQQVYACESGAWVLQGKTPTTKTCTGTDKVSAFDASTGQFTCTADISTTGGEGTVTGVTATAPVVSSGGTAPVISMAAATDSVAGYLTSADHTTFAAKAPSTPSYVALGTDAGLANERVLTGTSNQITVTDGGAGGAVTLSLPQAINTGAVTRFAGLNINGALGAGSGEVKLYGTSPLLWLQNSTQGQTAVQDSAGSLAITKTSATGTATIDIIPVVTDGTSAATVRFLRNTNTSGLAAVDIQKANTSTVNHRLAGNADSFIAADNGNLGVGTNSPTTGMRLDVNGSIKTNESVLELPYANGTCTTSINLNAKYGIQTLTLSGACAIGVTNLTAGRSFTLKLTQSSTTAPTFTTPYGWAAGTPPTWSTSAGKYDVLSCQSTDGTTLDCNGMTDVRH